MVMKGNEASLRSSGIDPAMLAWSEAVHTEIHGDGISLISGQQMLHEADPFLIPGIHLDFIVLHKK